MNMNKYVSFGENVRLHLLPNKGLLDIINQTKSYLDLNKTSKEIILRVDGRKTLLDLLKEQCDAYNQDYKDNVDWYVDMMTELNERGYINLTDEASDSKCRITGNDTYPTPLHATIEVTARCNLRCKHCYRESSPSVKDTMSFEDFKRLVDTLVSKGVLNCELTGGEIFFHPECMKMLEYALDKFYMVGILTNGTLLKEEHVQLLKKYKDKILVNVSLDSARPQVHDNFRGVEGAFKNACKGIKLLSDNGIFVRVAMAIFGDNIKEVEDVIKIAKALGASAFSYNIIDPFGRANTIEEGGLTDEMIIDFSRNERALQEKYKDFIPVVPMEEFDKANGVSANCGAGWRTITVDPFGNLRPCPIFPVGVLKIGNILKENYEDIFSSDIINKLWNLQSPLNSSKCDSKCKFKHKCSGCYLKGMKYSTCLDEPCTWVKHNNLIQISKDIVAQEL